MAEERLLDVSKSGGLSLGSVAALVCVLVVWVGTGAAAFARLSAVEARADKSETDRAQLHDQINGIDKRVTRGEDRTADILKLLEKLEKTMQDRTIYAKGKAE